MKKLLFLSALVYLPFTAWAQDAKEPQQAVVANQYIGFHAGSDYARRTDISNSGQKVGYQAGAIYGYDWGNQFRTEFELTYREGHRRTNYLVKEDKEVSKEHKSTHSLCYMLNACYDIKQLNVYDISPFVGFGVGYCQNTDEMKLQAGDQTSRAKEHDDRFAYQLIGGIKYVLADKTELVAKYNYLTGNQHAKNHGFALGLVRSF